MFFTYSVKPATTFDFVIVQNKIEYDCEVKKQDNKFLISINGQTSELEDNFSLSDSVVHANFGQADKLTMQLISRDNGGQISLQYMGTKVRVILEHSKIKRQSLKLWLWQFELQAYTDRAFKMLKHMPEKKEIDLSSVVLSPMPGIVKSIAVEVGQKVIEGHEICTVEAMKMQNKLVANRTGVVNNMPFIFIFFC